MIYLAEKEGKLTKGSCKKSKSSSVANVSDGRDWTNDGSGKCLIGISQKIQSVIDRYQMRVKDYSQSLMTILMK